MWCVQMGYGRREIADAMSEQAMKLAYNTPWYTTSGPAAALAKGMAMSRHHDNPAIINFLRYMIVRFLS